MLRCLFLVELVISAFLYDFHCVILRNRLVKSVPEGFTDDRASRRVRSAYTTVYILQQLYAFFSEDALHHHLVGTLMKQYPINQMVHSGLACDALDFGVIIRWRLIVQIYPNRAHPIIYWLLRWLINNHQYKLCLTG
jgi:hypothetical protein